MDNKMKNIVLTFHNVTDANWFIKTIRRIGCFYRFGTLDQLYARLTNGRGNMSRNMCFITFDDGERSVYDVVFPAIKRLNVPIAVFVSPLNVCEGGAFWFQRMRMIATDQLEAMKRLPLSEILTYINQLDPAGITNIDANINLNMFEQLKDSGLVTFGAHTQHHPILANESDEVSECELCDSVSQLSNMLDEPVRYFAYPNGSEIDFSSREINLLKRCGVKMAFTTKNGYAYPIDLYRIQRVGITRGNILHVLLKVMFPKFFIWLKRCR